MAHSMATQRSPATKHVRCNFLFWTKRLAGSPISTIFGRKFDTDCTTSRDMNSLFLYVMLRIEGIFLDFEECSDRNLSTFVSLPS